MRNLFKLTTVVLALLIVGCSSEENSIEIENTDAVNLSASIFQESNIGMYKGVFTTLDGEQRGAIEINIPDFNLPTIGFLADPYPRAILNLSNGQQYILRSNTPMSSGALVNNVEFVSNSVHFNFSVAANGSNPSVSNVVFNGLESDIIVRKHTDRAPAMAIPGTFACTDCGSHPVLGTGTTQTFNLLMFTTPGGDTDFDTQVTLGMNAFNGIGDQNSCIADGTLTTCTINSGDGVSTIGFMVSGAPVTWTGTHTFNNEATGPQDCSGASGTWTFESNNFGTLTGTFVSDAMCPTDNSGGLFISEIGDSDNFNNSGEMNSRFIEVTNGNTSDLDISGYQIQLFSNANTSAGSTFTFPANTLLTTGDSYVIASDEIEFNIIYAPVVADIQFGSFNSNGDDTFVLLDDIGTTIDIYGTIGVDQTGTCAEFEDGRAVRIAGTTEGSLVFDESEWIVRADSTIMGCTDHVNMTQDAPADFNPGTF